MVYQAAYPGEPGLPWTPAGTRKPRWTSSRHAMAPNAKILLVEAQSSSFDDLLAAVRKANRTVGVKEISMSWGGSEFSDEASYGDSTFTHSGIVYFASSGDVGGVNNYPGVSPDVVAAGGTSVYNRTPAAIFWGKPGGAARAVALSEYEPRPCSGRHRGHRRQRAAGCRTCRLTPTPTRAFPFTTTAGLFLGEPASPRRPSPELSTWPANFGKQRRRAEIDLRRDGLHIRDIVSGMGRQHGAGRLGFRDRRRQHL